MTARIRSVSLAGGTAEPPLAKRRVVSLDGLRGLAALVVVVHHSLLTWPSVAAQYQAPNRNLASWWLTFTPLHLVWAGTQAVIVFFILSGIVLTRPYLGRRPGRRWGGYYARRLLRLYVPVTASLGLAGVVVWSFPRHAGPGVSWWFADHAVHVTPLLLAHDALLLDGVSWVNDVLWSLRYEVAFSLLLPLVVVAIRRWPTTLWLNLPFALALVAVGQLSGNVFGQWMPYFAVGVALAAGWEELQALGARIENSRLRAVIWTALCMVAALALLSDWWVRLVPRASVRDGAVAMSLVAFGAALLCFLAVTCPFVRSICSGRFLQWAGGISFSLYLVHEPIVVSVSSLAGPSKAGVATTLMLGGAIAIGVATVFHRLVERPSQRWARAAGVWLDARRRGTASSQQSACSAYVPAEETQVLTAVPVPRAAVRHATAARPPAAPPRENDRSRLGLPPVPPPHDGRTRNVPEREDGGRAGSRPLAPR